MTRGRPFKKGISGNPSGRPAAIVAVVELARSYTTQAIQALAQIMTTVPDSIGQSDSARVAAANAILDRGWGKAPQHVHLTGDGESLGHQTPSVGALVSDELALVGREIQVLKSKPDLGPQDRETLLGLVKATTLLIREDEKIMAKLIEATPEEIEAEIRRIHALPAPKETNAQGK